MLRGVHISMGLGVIAGVGSFEGSLHISGCLGVHLGVATDNANDIPAKLVQFAEGYTDWLKTT